MSFLPTSKQEIQQRNWDSLDVILISGDAYVDHPSYGVSVIGRVLEKTGYRVGIIAQPDWRNTDDFKKLGTPRLFFGITAGNLDSMVSNYTAHKKPRKKDDYSPGGRAGHRPDRATIVYANRIREAFNDIPIAIGGIEASLRRMAHYDWWDNTVRRSILLDARADILVYGMGEKQIVEIAKRLSEGRDLMGIRGTVIVKQEAEREEGRGKREAGKRRAEGKEPVNRKSQIVNSQVHRTKDIEQRTESIETGKHASKIEIGDWDLDIGNYIEIPSYEEVKEDTKKFNEAFSVIYKNQDPFQGKTISQKHGNRFVIQYPPPLPYATHELDTIYELPFMKAWHPAYDKDGGVPGFETVKFSLISHRGCPGQCSFCALSMHQGRIVQSRTEESLVREARALTEQKAFRGTISDIGGPTANLYKAHCPLWDDRGACRDRSCLTPTKCKKLRLGYREGIKVYNAIMKLPKVKHLFIESGLRYDLLIDKETSEYLDHICRHHVSGQMKVAPEHSIDHVLKIMNKPSFHLYEQFAERFKETSKRVGKAQYLVHYIISAHPGSTLEDTLQLSLSLMKQRIYPEQIQDFMPLPLTLSGAMYYTGEHPLTGEKIYSAKTFRERKMHRALIQYRHPNNKGLVREALTLLKREDLIGRFQFRHQK
jgi:uncharacterized radical SAM protein YgiQ